MFTLYLILSHLIGDFLFQPSWLYKMKIRSKKGILLHATICALMISLVLLPYSNNLLLWIIIFVTGMTHFIFDVTKIVHEKKKDSFSLSPFLIDQIGHISVALLCGLYLTNAHLISWITLEGFYGIAYQNGSFALIVSALILVSYVVDIVRYQYMRTKNAKAEYTRDYPGMIKRTFLFSLFTLLLIMYFVATTNGFQPEMIGLMMNF